MGKSQAGASSLGELWKGMEKGSKGIMQIQIGGVDHRVEEDVENVQQDFC